MSCSLLQGGRLEKLRFHVFPALGNMHENTANRRALDCLLWLYGDLKQDT